MLERPLKTIVTSELEETIAKAITDLVGESYTVNIKNIDFECGSWAASELLDAVDMNIHISKAQDTEE